MPDNRVVTELVVTSNTAGADAYTAAMNKASTAADSTLATNDKMQASIDRQTVTMTGSYGRQAAQFSRLAAGADPVIFAQQKLEKATLTGAAALAAGKATQDEVNSVVGIYGTRLAAATAATGANAAATVEAAVATQGLAVAEGEAAVATQGLVVAEGEAAVAAAGVTRELIVMGAEGLRGNFSRIPGSILVMRERLGQAGASVLNFGTLSKIAGGIAEVAFHPVVLTMIAFAVAAKVIPKLFKDIEGGIGSADEVLKEHDGAIKAIKADWDAAKASAAQYASQAQTAIQFTGNADKLRLQLLELQQQSSIGQKLLLQQPPAALFGIGDANSGFNQAEQLQRYIDKYGVLAPLVQKLATTALNGKADILAFNEEIEKIALADPANAQLTKMALGLLDLTLDATKAANALKDTNDQVAKLDARFRTAEGAAEAASMNKTATALAQAQRERAAALLGANAVTPQQKADAASAAVLAKPQDFATDPTGALRAYEAATAAAQAYDKAATKVGVSSQKNFDAALKSAQKQTDTLKAEALAFGLSAGAAAEMKKQQELIDLAEQDHLTLTPKLLASIDAQAKAYGDATTALKKMKDAQTAEQFLGQSLFDAAKGATSLSDAFAKLADSIATAVEQALLLGSGPLAGVFGTSSSGASGGVLGSLFSGLFGGSGAGGGLMNPSANGNIFDHSNVVPFARGGIVDRPTIFPFASGIGLMGEAGPEAIVPLKRAANGQLGIQSGGGGGSSGGVDIQVFNSSSGATATARNNGMSGGRRQIQIMVNDIVTEGIANGTHDSALAGRFGVTPAKKRYS